MELNRKGTKKVPETVVNEEGSKVLTRLPEVQLYLEASNLKIKNDEFYNTADENLKKVIAKAKASNPEYVYGLARFLTDNGLKLAPVVLYATLSEGGYSFNPENIRGEHALGDGALKTFNTPQRIAEAISLVDGKYLTRLNNSFKQHTLKAALELMGPFTLRKNKMKTRKIKTKDLIKMLRPNPKVHGAEAQFYADLYKSIIEDTKLSKMTEDTTLIRVKANKELTDKEKKEYFQKNIDKIAINELIRNLRFITDKFNFEEEVEMKRKVIAKLNSIKNYRFLNIFDLIETCMHVPELESALFEVIKNFATEVKTKFGYHEDAVALFDVSGSMSGKGEELGFKYMVLLTLMFEKIKVYPFGDQLYPPNPNMTKFILDGKISKAYTLYKNKNEGTRLVDSVKTVLVDIEVKNLIVVSDEISWKEGSDLTEAISGVSSTIKQKGIKLILINPTISTGTVFDTNIVGMGSLTSAILYNVMLATNQKAFIEMVKNYQ